METLAQKALVGVAVTYMLLIVIIPFVQAFSHGLGPFVETLQEPDFQQARRRADGLCLAVFIVFKYCVAGSSGCGAARCIHPQPPHPPNSAPHCHAPAHRLLPALQAVKMTLLLSLVAVPINTAFGIQAALFLSRNEFWGKTFAISLLDLPFSISPVITGEGPGPASQPATAVDAAARGMQLQLARCQPASRRCHRHLQECRNAAAACQLGLGACGAWCATVHCRQEACRHPPRMLCS